MLYRLGTQLYFLAIQLAALFGNAKAKLWVDGRKNLIENIAALDWGTKQYLWFHCASLGEFEQGRPLIERVKNENPQQKILLTFFSPSGYEVRKNYTGADRVLYLPADTGNNAKRFVAAVKPKAALFVKYEFWEGYLKALSANNIPAFLVSGIFRPGQYFFKYKRLLPLRLFNYFFVQNDESLRLLNAHGFTNAEKTGDTRFDRVFDVSRTLAKLKPIEDFANGNKLCIAGSTWPTDEKLIATLFKTNMVGWKFIIAPHEVNEKRIGELLALFPKAILYTQAKETSPENATVMILDTIGTLSTAYRYAHISYVGGGFNTGIHNVLEAAVYGHPVFFGPNYQRFAEAVGLIGLKAAYPISTENELQQVFTTLNTDSKVYLQAATAARRYVLERVGATDKIYNHLKAQGLV